MLAMGPVFFTIIQTSLQKGFKTAVMVATGVMLSDVFYIGLAFFGLTQFLDNDQFRFFLAFGGGMIMLGYGVVLLLRKSPLKTFSNKAIDGNIFKHFAKGWLINFLNPFVFIFWIGVAGMANVSYGNDVLQNLAFFSGIISVVYTADIAKSFLANRLRRIVTPSFITGSNKVLGVFLIVFGIWLFSNAFNIETPLMLSNIIWPIAD